MQTSSHLELELDKSANISFTDVQGKKAIILYETTFDISKVGINFSFKPR